MVTSIQARQLADWIAATGDHTGAPFIIVDKKRASVFVFDANARLRAQSAVLLGAALGDDSVPGIGTRPMAQILPAERTTPAGRFVAERGRNTQGEDVVWVDYDAAVSMHRVRTGNVVERRAERLATPTIDDNRISYGCINVPVAFYENFIQPIFAMRKAIVYVLPDDKPMEEVFGMSKARQGFDDNNAMTGPVPGGNGVFGDSGAFAQALKASRQRVFRLAAGALCLDLSCGRRVRRVPCSGRRVQRVPCPSSASEGAHGAVLARSCVACGAGRAGRARGAGTRRRRFSRACVVEFMLPGVVLPGAVVVLGVWPWVWPGSAWCASSAWRAWWSGRWPCLRRRPRPSSMRWLSTVGIRS